MKRALVFTCGSVLVAVGAACAGTDEDPAAAAPEPETTLGDAQPPEETIDDDPPIDGPNGCSAAGWCATELPDTDLTLKDIWPLPGHAFAIAESATRGVKVLEWTDADSKWVYIDDHSQNAIAAGLYAGKLWAPSANEVYFTVAPRTIYHGTKQNQPNTGWTWAHQQLDDHTPEYPASYGDHYRGRPTFAATKTTYTALGVFGTGADDVYAWYANTIYHRTKNGNGAETWDVEYVADDRDDDNQQLFFVAATATGKDDVWFAGGRGGPPGQNGCPVLVHKTAAGYRRAADGLPATGGSTSDGGVIGFPDGGIVFPPPADGGTQPPVDGGIVFPPPFDGGIVFPPLDAGIVSPPLDGGGIGLGDGGVIGFPPPADGGGIGLGDGGVIGFPPPADAGAGDSGVIIIGGGGGGIIVGDGGIPFLDGGLNLDGGLTVGDSGAPPIGGATMCKARAGSILLGSALGWIGSVEAIAPQRVVLLKGGREVAKVAMNGNDYTADVAQLPSKPSKKDFVSLWAAPNDSVWLGGPNIILRTSQDFTDGGTFDVSTISLSGGWLETPIYQIRGSSNVDRWAVGDRHALHKTTP